MLCYVMAWHGRILSDNMVYSACDVVFIYDICCLTFSVILTLFRCLQVDSWRIVSGGDDKTLKVGIFDINIFIRKKKERVNIYNKNCKFEPKASVLI